MTNRKIILCAFSSPNLIRSAKRLKKQATNMKAVCDRDALVEAMALITGVVAGKMALSRAIEPIREEIEKGPLDETAFVMTLFRPRIRKKEVNAIERRRR